MAKFCFLFGRNISVLFVSLFRRSLSLGGSLYSFHHVFPWFGPGPGYGLFIWHLWMGRCWVFCLPSLALLLFNVGRPAVCGAGGYSFFLPDGGSDASIRKTCILVAGFPIVLCPFFDARCPYSDCILFG